MLFTAHWWYLQPSSSWLEVLLLIPSHLTMVEHIVSF